MVVKAASHSPIRHMNRLLAFFIASLSFINQSIT